jgi:hypothetical protein
VTFDRQDVGEPVADQPTQIVATWEVTLDDGRVGELHKLQHRTAVRGDDEVVRWRKGAVEYALYEGARGKKADLPAAATRRKLAAIAAVRERLCAGRAVTGT